MDRRTLLRCALVAGTVGLAGCTGDGDGSDGGETSPDGTDTPTASPTTTGEAAGPSQTDDEPTETLTSTEREADTATPTDEPTDEGSTERETDTPTSTDRETETPTATEQETESPTPTPAADQEVVVGPGGSLRFDPETFTVSAGDTVVWVWDSGGHNVSPRGQPGGASWPGKDEQSSYPEGTRHAHTFEVAGEYDYVCEPHQSVGMTGSFTVEQ